MDYKSFQKAITDRLGSQFGVSVLIAFVYLNWRVIFKMFDLETSIDCKIGVVEQMASTYDWLQWFKYFGHVLLILLIFQTGNYFAKIIGVFFENILLKESLNGLKLITRWQSNDDFTLIQSQLKDEKESNSENLKSISRLEQEVSSLKSQATNYSNETNLVRKEAADLQKKFADVHAEKITIELKSEQFERSTGYLTKAVTFLVEFLNEGSKNLIKLDRSVGYLKRLIAPFDQEITKKLNNTYKGKNKL